MGIYDYTADKYPFGIVNNASVDSIAMELSPRTTIKKVPLMVRTIKESVDGPDSAKAYRDNMEESKKLLLKAISDTMYQCPSTNLVLFGYGQGSQVIHEALSVAHEGLLKFVAAAWLTSDPIRESSEKNQYDFNGGAPAAGNGFYLNVPESSDIAEFAKFAPPLPAHLPEMLKLKVISVCYVKDSNCSIGGGEEERDSIYLTKELYDEPAKWAADILGLCTDVTIFGLRGSATAELSFREFEPSFQSKTSGKFGTVNTLVASAIKERLPEAMTSKRIAVPYILNESSGSEKNPNDYRESVKSATGLTRDVMWKAVTDCPNTKLIVVGYQDGAQIAHEAVSQLPAALALKIGAILLISDPVGVASGKNQVRYAGQGMTPAQGNGYYIQPNSSEPSPDYYKRLAPVSPEIPDYLRDRVMSVCNNDDAYCNSNAGQLLGNNKNVPYSKPDFIDFPAEWAAGALTRICADVTFFAARGSGEAPDSGQPVQRDATSNDYMSGFGTPVASLAYAIRKKYPEGDMTTFDYFAVEYKALSVEEAFVENSQYPASVKSGIVDINGPDKFRQIITKCPATKVVMLGYSQGGQVIHEIIMRLSKEERSHISNTVLIADASRNPDDAGSLTFMGNKTSFEFRDSKIYDGMGVMRAVGIADTVCVANSELSKASDSGRVIGLFFSVRSLVNVILGDGPAGFIGNAWLTSEFCNFVPQADRFSHVISPDKMPDDIYFKTLNVCAEADLVCDANISADLANTIVKGKSYFSQIDDVHAKGYNNLGFYDFPAAWSYGRLRFALKVK
jgi:predicted esterase